MLQTSIHSLASFDLKCLSTHAQSGNQLDLITHAIVLQITFWFNHYISLTIFFITFTLHGATPVPPTPLLVTDKTYAPFSSHISSVVSSSLWGSHGLVEERWTCNLRLWVRISVPAGIVLDWGETLEQGTKPPTAPRAPHPLLHVCALGWVKCREHISLLVMLCKLCMWHNKAHHHHLPLTYPFLISGCECSYWDFYALP